MITETLRIYTPDDSHSFNTTIVDVAGENMVWSEDRYGWGRRWHRNGDNTINPSHYRNATEPTIEGIKVWLKNYLRWGVKGRPTFKGMFIIKKGMNEANIHCMKMGTTY
jgi:hypothetical protein